MEQDDLSLALPRLRHGGALPMVMRAAAAGVPPCITITDAGGIVIARLRTDGARLNAPHISVARAVTAASAGAPTCEGADDRAVAMATGGHQTGLLSGLPTWIDGHLASGIGVLSGPGEVDRDCAMAAFAVSPRLSWTAP